MSFDSKMTSLADAVRTLSGATSKLSVEEMTDELNDVISSGGGGGSTQPSVQQATPTITVNANGLITASATQQAGTVSAGTKSATHQLSASDDADLIASNIVSGKTIFGVQGSHSCSAGAPDLQAKTVTPTTSQQVVKPDSNYDGLSQVTVNAMPTATQATPSISVNSSTGVITASATQSAGYVTAGTKSATSNLTTQAAKTVTPTTSNQTAVASGVYTTGAVTVAGDSNLKAANIKKGVKIFNVTGSYEATAGGGSVYPDGAFATVTEFTDGKQYALVAVIDGTIRYLNTTTYNDYTMNATAVTISEENDEYFIFSATPALFTAVASGSGFLLQNGTNYLHGTTNNGTALRVGTTQAVWTVDSSATGGFSSGKYYEKENERAVWLRCNDGSYDWSIKYETAGSFGYDREGRDNTYSTGFVPFVLCEYVAGEGEVSPIVDTSDATAKSSDMAKDATAYVNGKKVVGSLEVAGDEYFFQAAGNGYDNNTKELCPTFYLDRDMILKEGNQYYCVTPLEESIFGNATAADVASGKTFTSVNGAHLTGTAQIGGGSVIKSGTTTSGTINTGLASIEQFFIYKESITATGLIHLHYTPSATSRMYASAWSTQNYGTKTITNGTGGVTVNGGTLTISATQAAQGALSSGVTYKWVAVGAE